MITLNIRCCCEPRRILGTVELAETPTGEGVVITKHGSLHIREYYELRDGNYYTEWAVVGHEQHESQIPE